MCGYYVSGIFWLLLSCSVRPDSLWPHGLQHTRLPCSSLSPMSLKLMSIKLVMPSNHLILCHPLLLLCSVFPSIRVFSNEWALCIRWPKYGAQLQHSQLELSVLPINIQGLFPLGLTGSISLLFKGLSRVFSSTSSKASILWRSAFFIVQPYTQQCAGET